MITIVVAVVTSVVVPGAVVLVGAEVEVDVRGSEVVDTGAIVVVAHGQPRRTCSSLFQSDVPDAFE